MSHANALTSYIFFQDMIYINMCISLHTLHNVCTASYKKKTNFLCVEGSRFSTTKVRLNRKVKKKVWHGWGVSLSQLIAHSPSHLSLCKKKRKKEALGWWLIGQVRRLGKYAVSDSQWPLKQCDGTVGLKTLYWRRVENSLVWDSQRIFLWTVFAYSLPFFYVSRSLTLHLL